MYDLGLIVGRLVSSAIGIDGGLGLMILATIFTTFYLN